MPPLLLCEFKARVLLALATHGPQPHALLQWPDLQAFNFLSQEDFSALKAHAIEELVEAEFIVSLPDRVFLSRPLEAFELPLRAELSTLLRLAAMLRLMGNVADAFHLTPRDLALAAETGLNMAASYNKLQDEVASLKNQAQDATLGHREAKKTIHKLNLQIDKLSKGPGKPPDDTSKWDVLKSHRLENGLCTFCGLEAEYLFDSKISCSDKVRAEFAQIQAAKSNG